jgi:hypothetical protein
MTENVNYINVITKLKKKRVIILVFLFVKIIIFNISVAQINIHAINKENKKYQEILEDSINKLKSFIALSNEEINTVRVFTTIGNAKYYKIMIEGYPRDKLLVKDIINTTLSDIGITEDENNYEFTIKIKIKKREDNYEYKGLGVRTFYAQIYCIINFDANPVGSYETSIDCNDGNGIPPEVITKNEKGKLDYHGVFIDDLMNFCFIPRFNKTLNDIFKWEYPSGKEFLSKNSSLSNKDTIIFIFSKGKYGIANLSFDEIVPCKYDYLSKINENLFCAELNNKYGIINQEGSEKIPFKYDLIAKFKDDLFYVILNGKYGVINNVGDIIIPIIYDYIGFFSNGFAIIKKNNKYGYMNEMLQIQIPIIFDDAKDFSLSGIAKVRTNNRVFYINKNGNMIKY